jgi:hypothetical protein
MRFTPAPGTGTSPAPLRHAADGDTVPGEKMERPQLPQSPAGSRVGPRGQPGGAAGSPLRAACPARPPATGAQTPAADITPAAPRWASFNMNLDLDISWAAMLQPASNGQAPAWARK